MISSKNVRNPRFAGIKNPATAMVAGDALTGAYTATLSCLAVTAVLLAAATGWCFRGNPKKATASATATASRGR